MMMYVILLILLESSVIKGVKTMKLINIQSKKKNSLAQGSIFTIIIILLLISGITITGINIFSMDRIKSQEKNYIKQIADNESQNSLSYAIWLLNTPQDEGGGKCKNELYVKNKDIEILQIEKLPNVDNSYIIKRFFRLEGEDYKNIKIIGIAKIYDLSNQFLQEKRTEINADILYRGNDEDVSDPCNARVLRLNHQSWKQH